jgi:hypothetical protein
VQLGQREGSQHDLIWSVERVAGQDRGRHRRSWGSSEDGYLDMAEVQGVEVDAGPGGYVWVVLEQLGHLSLRDVRGASTGDKLEVSSSIRRERDARPGYGGWNRIPAWR